MKNLWILTFLSLGNMLMAQSVIGDWEGTLEVQGTQLKILFHVAEKDGNLASTMDSPDQGANGIPMEKTTFENGTLTIAHSAMGINYSAQLKDAELEGTFRQGGMSIPLTMSREEVAKKIAIRSQDPTDFPYRQEEVKFKNSKGGHHLAGTLTIPASGKFEKVVVLISGSGPQNRNEELLNHRPFLVLSDHLTRQGIAVLRYDDRGVGESEGKFDAATSKDFAADAAAAVAFLKKRKDMHQKQIGLMGHSEGGMIAPIVASENKDVDFIVLLAGPGINIKDLMMLQTDKIAEAEGSSKKERKENAIINAKIFDYLIKNANLTKEELKMGLDRILDEEYDTLSEKEKEEIGDKKEELKNQTKMLLSDWFLYFMQFEPADFLTKVKCPVLAVNGELDLQVTSKENLEGIQKSLKKAGNKNVTIHEFKKLNHLFQTTETGAPSEYGRLEETFNIEALKYISDWVQKL